ncbi:MAG: hypothetical protein MGU50_11260 [Trichodesmium sp. MAG_R02]|nr:hypothetical protein [Trichodesmium sp. MAG_R02]
MMIQVAIEKYKKVQDLNWNEAEKYSGKIVKIKGFARDEKVIFFLIMCVSQKNRIYCH